MTNIVSVSSTAFAVVLALGAAGCSDSSSDADSADAARRAITSTFGESPDPNGMSYDPAEADCITDAIVRELREERLGALGLGSSDSGSRGAWIGELTDAERVRVGDVLEECVDIAGNLAAMLEGSDLDAESASCVAETYVATGLAAESLLSFEHDPELNDRIDDAFEDAYEQCDVTAPPS